MFKLGVYSIAQLEKNKTRTVFGAAKKVSVTLLDAARESQLSPDAYSSVMFDLNDDRGTFKRTYQSRFDNFDDKCIEVISRSIRDSNLRLHDVAVSSAETAVDFFEKLSRFYPSIQYVASDYDPYLTVLGVGPLRVSTTSHGSIVELLLPPFVLTPMKPDRLLYPVNRALSLFLQRTLAKRLVARFRRGELSPDKIRQLDLFCPRAKSLASSDQRFQLEQFDILQADDRKFDCIRAMNVLNERYFSAENYSKIVANLHRSVRTAGLLIVGSNDDSGSPVAGAIYKRDARGFELTWSAEEKPFADKYIRQPVC